MKNKRLYSILCVLFLTSCLVFAGGQQDSGKAYANQATEIAQLDMGDVLYPQTYLSNFTFPYKVIKDEPLSVFINQEHENLLTSGGTSNILVGLRVNDKELFKVRDVNYVIYIQNPAFLQTERVFKLYESALNRIFDIKSEKSRIALYSGLRKSIQVISKQENITKTLQAISSETKNKDNQQILKDIYSELITKENGLPWRVIWVSDENVFKTSENISFYEMMYESYKKYNISFSFLGYGPSPLWNNVNNQLCYTEGNTYYGKTYQYLENSVVTDFEGFAYPAIKDIKVSFSTYPWVISSTRKITQIDNMNVNESKILLYSFAIDSAINNQANLQKENEIAVGNIYIEYFNENTQKKTFTEYPISIKLTDNYDLYSESINPIVTKYVVLQETPYILKRVCIANNRKEYGYALRLLNNQIEALTVLQQTSKDSQLALDIEMLEKFHESIITESQKPVEIVE